MHKSVLLEECIEGLNLKDDSIVVDCTLGRAGHSSEALKKIKNGYLYSFDQDEDSIITSTEKLSKISDNFKIINNNFVHIKEELNKLGVNNVDAIMYDLGVSSPQLDETTRGFSFHKDARLDMRMDKNNPIDAYYVVNNYTLDELIRILRNYGEEKYATSIARGIIKNRPITTTLELADVIKENVPFSYKKDKHPARKTFQAIRIEVNDELNVFEKSLTDALDLLNVGGRICVITFHSLEDRICKNIFKSVSSVDANLKKLPIIPDEYKPKFKLVDVIEPTSEEILENPRARSAKLRIIERVR